LAIKNAEKMKANNNIRLTQHIVTVIFLILFMGCEREISDLELATYPTNPEVFVNGFSPGLNYAAFGGSVPTAFDVDNSVTYSPNSTASMRFEVPDAGDPRGAYAGGVFFTTAGRDLSGYTALTFWAKASQAANLDLVGFGNDLGESKYQVSISNLPVNSNWKKYYIPIPDPSKMKMERGMFFYAEGPENDKGYTFWIDEVKFENLGTIAHPRFAILNGQDQTETSFVGVSKQLGGLQSFFNLPTGIDQAVNAAPAYFEFVSSNESIAIVDENGMVQVVGGPGNAQITAHVGDVVADGSLTINSVGNFQHAPTPPHAPENVISIFSDTYTNVPVDYYNGYWEPWQTTLSADFEVNGDHILHYTNFNFVGIQFGSPPVNASTMTHFRMDIYLPNALSANAPFRIELNDNAGGGSGLHTFTITPAQAQQWISLDIPLSSFTGLSSRTALWQIVFVDVNGNIPNFYADNIYFRKN
jgi:hypothetical protein